ncbi:transcription termination factor NusA [[Mycoplasma] phocae]|uniref:Transcription termination/antitermination protein NusA n=1 Tax=[Mycoplasma] phocae TaxID=142651 RepID=A0A2Z5IQK8_9BACT|nr:transcription termination factor NusA [[Mycoplasma] phocae]AXE61065.1 transcription termination factor NusA [[Mycoplasma] phocae]
MNESNLNSKDFFIEMYNLSKIKNIDENKVFDLIKKAISKIILEEYDESAELEFILDNKNLNFKVINHKKTVIDDPKSHKDVDNISRCIEVPISIAKKIDPNVEVNDDISEEINFDDFQKRDYVRISSAFFQYLKELEHQMIYAKYLNKIGEVVKAKINYLTKSGIILELTDGAAAYMPPSSTNARITSKLKPGDLIDVYIEEVKEESKNAQVIVSSVESKLLNKLFAQEVPEVANGFIEIVKIARIPGERSKVAIRKTELAPVGLQEIGCIMGDHSHRINAISALLGGEKIDVILYSDDPKEFIINAMNPSKVIDVISNDSGRKSIYPSYYVIVPNTQHTLAIGRKGQNVSLASELTRMKLDILSQKQAIENNIPFNIENGNVTEEEIKQLELGKRLQSNYKRRPNRTSSGMLENTFDINEFDEDLAEMRQKAQQNDDIFEKQMFSGSFDEQLEETLSKFEKDLSNESHELKDEDVYSDLIENIMNNKLDYEKITSTKMKDFKKDDDLAVGLDDIDLSDLDDENW